MRAECLEQRDVFASGASREEHAEDLGQEDLVGRRAGDVAEDDADPHSRMHLIGERRRADWLRECRSHRGPLVGQPRDEGRLDDRNVQPVRKVEREAGPAVREGQAHRKSPRRRIASSTPPAIASDLSEII